MRMFRTFSAQNFLSRKRGVESSITLTICYKFSQKIDKDITQTHCNFTHLGMTSEGGGSVAFPVMTLAFKIAPVVARDFSLLIQSCGMTAAAFTIIWMKV